MTDSEWGDEKASGFDDDNVWTQDMQNDNSEQDCNIPDFSEQDYIELKNLGSMDSTQLPPIYNSLKRNYEDNGRGGNQPRKRKWNNNQEGWQPARNFGNSSMNSNGSRFRWGMGYGPSGPYSRPKPVEHRMIRYLMGCGLPRESVGKLSKELLDIMDAEYCGLCHTSLESYQTSRAHYLSKGHAKKQTKWKSQSDRPKREQPLQPRDLYCELCNVQITSKVHADSHYAGRPHRAIVEGRKLPKNAHLLQKSMKSRLDMLINREKEFLEPVKEVEQVNLPAKAIQPELYCDICKTSVTCTEQMTSHLNGKRHLTKEKQHILKMMKGEADGKQDEEQDAGKDNDPESQEDQGDQGDDDDWGSGGGAWDDPQ